MSKEIEKVQSILIEEYQKEIKELREKKISLEVKNMEQKERIEELEKENGKKNIIIFLVSFFFFLYSFYKVCIIF